SRRRTLAEDTPLDHPTSEAELRRLAGPTVTEEGLGSARALAIFEHIFAPACISTDHPKHLSFIPSAPTKAAVAFDLVVSASALYGGSWLEGAGVVHAENEVLRWLAGEFGLPETAGGVFVQGGTIGNLSALVAARNAKKEQLGESRPARWVIVCSAEAHSSVASAAEVMDVDVAPVATGDGGAECGVRLLAPHRRRLRTGRDARPAGQTPVRRGRTGRFAHRRSAQVALRPFRCLCADLPRSEHRTTSAHAARRVPRHPHRGAGVESLGLRHPAHTAASRTAAVVFLGQLRRGDLPGGDRPLDRPGPRDRHGDQAAGEPAARARTRAVRRRLRTRRLAARGLRGV